MAGRVVAPDVRRRFGGRMSARRARDLPACVLDACRGLTLAAVRIVLDITSDTDRPR